MDLIDKKIVYLLRDDSRRSFQSVGGELGLSEAAIRQRVKKLVERKEIKRFTIDTHFPARAIVAIKTKSNTPTKRIVEKMKKSQIQELFEVAGDFTLFAIIGTDSLELLNDVVEHIRSIEGVIDTQTYTVLKQD